MCPSTPPCTSVSPTCVPDTHMYPSVPHMCPSTPPCTPVSPTCASVLPHAPQCSPHVTCVPVSPPMYSSTPPMCPSTPPMYPITPPHVPQCPPHVPQYSPHVPHYSPHVPLYSSMCPPSASVLSTLRKRKILIYVFTFVYYSSQKMHNDNIYNENTNNAIYLVSY